MSRRSAVAAILAIGTLVAACATVDGPGSGAMRGASAGVAWEIEEVRQVVAPDGQEIRWLYTVVLRETAGRGIQFEKVESGSSGGRILGSVTASEFRQRLAANGELRLGYQNSIYFTAPGAAGGFGAVPGGREGMTVLRRYHGKDDRGQAVRVDVRIQLDPSVGARADPGVVALPASVLGPAGVPVWELGYEWRYRWERSGRSGSFAWVVDRVEDVDGVGHYVIGSGSREIYYRKADLAWHLEKVSGAGDVRAVPPLTLPWPLSVGRTSQQSYRRETLRDGKSEDLARSHRIEAVERVTVPGGTFATFKVVARNSETNALAWEGWFAPDVKQWIRLREYLADGARVRELTSYRLEARSAPVATAPTPSPAPVAAPVPRSARPPASPRPETPAPAPALPAPSTGTARTADPTPPSRPQPGPPSPTEGLTPLGRATAREAEARQLLKDGRYTEGVSRAREALALREEALGARHLDVAASLTTLGELYRGQGQYPDAERLHRRALGIREELLGRDHPVVAENLNSLAMVHNARATYADAAGMLQRALEILEGVKTTLIRNYALQAEVLENLAKVYRALGKMAEADEAEARAAALQTLR